MTERDCIAEIESSLRPLASPERAAGAKAYLKSDLEFLGLTTNELRGTVRAWLAAHRDMERTEILHLVDALWEIPVHELRAFGMEILLLRPRLLESGDVDLLERMLRRSKSWAYVDAIAVHLVGPLVERDARLNRRLDRWVRDDDFWIRRAALLSLLRPLRQGGGDWDRFARYADALLDEKEFFIRKAIGWVLREVAKKRPALVRDFLAPRIGHASGVTVREAVKYLPARDREDLLAGRANAR